MIPTDGTLKLEVENLTGEQDSIYVGAYSHTMLLEHRFSNGYIAFQKPALPFLLGQAYVQNIPVTSEGAILVYWSFDPSTKSVSFAPFRDSIFVTRGDTASFRISL
jgi:hypothetical protein